MLSLVRFGCGGMRRRDCFVVTRLLHTLMAASVDPAPVAVADKSTLLIYEDPAFVTSEFPQEANHWSFLQERARPSSPGVIQLSRAAFTRLLANPAGIQDLTELRDLHLADAHFLENLQSWVDFCKAIPPTVWAGVQKLRVDFGGQGVGDLLEQLEDAHLLTSIEHLQIFDVKRSEKLFDSIARISKLRMLSLETSYYAPELKKDWQPRTPEFMTPVRLSVSVPYLKRDLMPWLSTFADAPDRHFRSIHSSMSPF
ncbi:hypothetical protein BKA62DRAFT_489375 [Auriculariales sp. MPI-PUGE-AT-0066]|nr:hypothetical protein BKA62DRAFT_489375 [Auriculariales sp. MPI-PUGE-AT-0066]